MIVAGRTQPFIIALLPAAHTNLSILHVRHEFVGMAGIAIVGVPHHTRNSTMNMQTTCTAHIDVDDIGHGHWCCYILHIQYKRTVTGVTSMLQQSSIHPSIRASRTDGAEDCSLMFCMSFVGMWIYRQSHRIVRSQQDEVFGPAFAGLSPRK